MTQPLDVHLGGRVRALRRLRRLSQEVLAEHLGVSTQQVQKYEKAANRISAASLFGIATLLEAPVSYFFEEADSVHPRDQGRMAPSDMYVLLPPSHRQLVDQLIIALSERQAPLQEPLELATAAPAG